MSTKPTREEIEESYAAMDEMYEELVPEPIVLLLDEES